MGEEKEKSFRELMRKAREKSKARTKERKDRINAWSERRRAKSNHYSEDSKRLWGAFLAYLRSRKKSDAEPLVDAYGHLQKAHPHMWRIIQAGVVLLYGGGTLLLTWWIVIPKLVVVYDFTLTQATAIGIQIEAGLLVVAAAWVSAYLWGKRRGKQGTVNIDELRQLLKEDREATIQALLSDLPIVSKDTPKESSEQSPAESQ